MAELQNIKVKDLASTSSISVNASFLALTDSANNEVQLITKSNLINTLISSDVNNGLNNNNGLYVANTGDLDNLETTDKTSLVDAINENVTRLNQPVTSLASSGTINLADNKIYKITPNGNITFNLPVVTDLTVFHQILIQLKLDSTYTVNLGTTYFFNLNKPAFNATGLYNIIYEYDVNDSCWVCGAIYKGVVA